ncbi:hypothetical protein QQF64_016981 [Cirrhinus molitorella]|uniref:non-specific serine/threonine protein kinase n=1 Tax=Cirrhinus molitorella TaxID=172907 RepID=A0ABR3LPE6_9TELE
MAFPQLTTTEGETFTLTAWVSETSSFESIVFNDEMAFPPEKTEKPTKGKKAKAARTFFRRVCKAVKRPFSTFCDPDRVVHLTPQTDTLDDRDVTPLTGPSRIKPSAASDPAVPELVCLPGQVCEDPEMPPCLPGSSGIEQTADPKHAPDSSSSNLCDKKAKKGRKRKAVRAFFRSACKAVKKLFPYCDPNKVQPPKAEPDQDESEEQAQVSADLESMPVEESGLVPEQQVSADLKSVPVEEGPSEIEQEADDAVCPSSLSASVPSTVSETVSDTEPEAEIDRPRGSVVSLFEIGHLIASGAFSKVYEGTHIFSEKFKVAIKCIPKRRVDRYLDIDGHAKPVLAEVALMLRLEEAPSCPNIIRLHHWLEDESSFSLIMECPEPCKTLEDYVLFSDPISEGQARFLMLQVVRAVKHCNERGVYHGDIRSRNILVNLHSLELKLIDFRCARLITSEGFKSSEYQGSDAYTPSEVIMQPVFHAKAANVWALGVLLFEIVHRYLPFESFDRIQHGYVKMDPNLSSACHDLIFCCLNPSPIHRLTLEQLEEHSWMKA